MHLYTEAFCCSEMFFKSTLIPKILTKIYIDGIIVILQQINNRIVTNIESRAANSKHF